MIRTSHSNEKSPLFSYQGKHKKCNGLSTYHVADSNVSLYILLLF